MKKAILLIPAVAVLAAIILWSGCRTVTSAEEVGELEASVVDLKGDCTYQKPDSDSWQDAEENKKYGKDFSLRTGHRSFMELIFAGPNTFRMKSNTKVIVGGIEELSQEKGSGVVKVIKLDLLDGEVGVKLKKLPKDHMIKVAGPTAVAGASGTGFTVLAEKDTKLTKTTVYESKVVLSSLDKPGKAVELAEFQEATAAPWKGTMIAGTGVGYLSSRILGEDFIKNVQEPPEKIVIEAKGTGTPPEELTDKTERRTAAEGLSLKDAYSNMAKIILPMSVDDETKVADLLRDDSAMSKRVYAVIADSKVTEMSFNDDDTAAATVEINLTDLGKALGKDLEKVLASVREITKADYLEKFGNRAYTTTLRAAEVGAQRNITERLYGSVILLGRTLEDEGKADNTVVIKIRGIVRGAKPVLTRYFADGSIHMTMEAPGDQVQEELGTIVGDTWLTSPEAARIDDFEMMEQLAELE